MPQDWRLELIRVLILVLAAVLIGFVTGYTQLAVIVTLTSYLVYAFYQLHRLSKWLTSVASDGQASPPESTGFWGLLFDGIYRLQRGERQAIKELQHILSRAQQSVAALNVGVVLVDKKDDLEWWNPAAESLIGFRYPEDKGQKATNLIRSPLFADYYAQGTYQESLTIKSPVDNNVMLEIQITLFGEREKLMIVRDITQIHRLELMRKDFVANVSHELRTPVTVISGYLESLTENNHVVDPKWHKPLEQMYQQSKRVESILSDLLLLSHLETRAIPSAQSAIEVHALLREIQSEASLIFSEQGHTISVDCDEGIYLTGVRSEVFSAISNLVFNAAKYTPDGGKIELKCEETEEQIKISIIDNGIGIELQHIPRLTERFYRVDVSRSKVTGGTGLGLAIVKHILMRHGAKLEISSVFGEGSCFSCVFIKNKSTQEAIKTDENLA